MFSYFWAPVYCAGLYVRQVCTFRDQVAKPQILSRSSSEPGPSSLASTHTPHIMRAVARCHSGDHAPEPGPADIYTGKHTNKDSCTQTLIPVLSTHTHKKEPRNHRFEGEQDEVMMESTPGEEQNPDTSRWRIFELSSFMILYHLSCLFFMTSV